MLSGLTSMLGPMMGGMAGGMFQPGSDAKAQAQSQQDAKYAQFRSGLANTMNGNLFGMSPAMQKVTNFPVQSKEVGMIGAGPETKASSGWDSFLSGAAKVAGNFATGVMAGLQSYDPNRPLSALAGGYMGATRGLQLQQEIESGVAKANAATEVELKSQRAFAELKAELDKQEQARAEADWRRQASEASVASRGIAMGVQSPPPLLQRPNDLDVQVGMDPLSAAQNVARLIGAKR